MNTETNYVQHLKIKRTYKYLVDAFLELLQEKPLEQISVVEICDRALVHRTTFYKHFEDKYHLLNYMIQDIKSNIQIALRNEEYKGINSYSRGIVNAMCSFVDENKSIQYLLLVQHNSKDIKDIIHQCIVEDVKSMLKEYERRNNKKINQSIDVLANFVAGGFISVLIWWIKDGMPVEREKLVCDMEQLFNSLVLKICS